MGFWLGGWMHLSFSHIDNWIFDLALLWQICNLGDSLFVRSVIHREPAYGGWRWLVIGGMILRLG